MSPQKFKQLLASRVVGSEVLIRVQMPAARSAGLVDIIQEQIHRRFCPVFGVHIDIANKLSTQQPEIVQVSLYRYWAVP
jgi:hypothetical protein